MNEGLPTLSRILFIDIVGFSKKPSHNQRILIQKLTSLVQQTSALNSLKKECRVELPTGDGIALALWGPPELPLLAAIELAELIKEYNSQCPPSLIIEIRTGINSGEVFTVTDINKQRNIVGEGINNTQRVMDFGDAGHIMASKNLVEEILDVAPQYIALLHDAGIFSDKHGVLHHLYNVFDWKTGNAEIPTRNRKEQETLPAKHLWQSLYEQALWETNFLRHPLMESIHIFLALTKLDNTQQAIIALNQDPTQIRRSIRKAMGKKSATSTREVAFSESLQQNLATVWQYAAEAARDVLEEDFIRSILNGKDKQSVAELLQSAGIVPSDLLSCFVDADGFASCMESALPVQLPPEVVPSAKAEISMQKSIASDADQAITDIHQAMTQPVSKAAAGLSMNVTLLVDNGPQKGRRFEFREPELFIVGRSPDANFVLDRSDPCVSRKHFMIEIVPPRCYLKDFGSLNGTLVNNEKCQQAELHDGDMISAGKTSFVVKISRNAAGSGLNCSRCGNLYHAPYAQDSQKELLCPTCKSELELEKLGKFAKTKIPVKAYCSECRADVGKYAASDGKGLLLSDVARYLCKDCFTRKSSASPATQIGQYHLLQQLGQGGMGSVFLAWDAATCRLGALKRILLPEPDTKVARRFIREMKIMAEFSHPHLVRIYEDGVHEGAPYFFSEFLDGGSLTRYMKRNGGKLSSREALQITCDILSGLEFFHNSGHIHRDIKPSNILLNSTEEGMIPTAKIADFGLAKSFVGFGGTKLTKANEFAGSLYYTPPEQIINFSRVGPTADIYSAGVTLYQILTGMLPYNFQSTSSANSMKDSLLVVLEEPIIPIRERSATIPATLAAIVEKAIAKKAEDRFATAVIFKAELQQYLETMP